MMNGRYKKESDGDNEREEEIYIRAVEREVSMTSMEIHGARVRGKGVLFEELDMQLRNGTNRKSK